MTSLSHFLSSLLGVFGIVIFWLSVCTSAQKSNQSLVTSSKGFHSYAHSLSSGKISILNEKQIHIENIIYDGTGPAAWFAVGSSGDYKSERPTNFVQSITRIPDENGSLERVKKYDGKKNITLTLPAELNVTDITFLVLYCVDFNHNFGYVEFPKGKDIDIESASLPATAFGNVVTTLEPPKPPKGTSASTSWAIEVIIFISIIALIAITIVGVFVRKKLVSRSQE